MLPLVALSLVAYVIVFIGIETGFISDEEDEGHPSDGRISLSTFRRLAGGCAGIKWDGDDNKPYIDPKVR